MKKTDDVTDVIRVEFVQPEVTVFGSIAQLTRTNCPAHGIANETSPPTNDTSNPSSGCQDSGGLGAKKT